MSPAWASYRQALRDITGQAGFPYAVTWPTKPE
ncbi:MAG: phage tail assembly chaperone [Burkholderiaceae bacterium]